MVCGWVTALSTSSLTAEAATAEAEAWLAAVVAAQSMATKEAYCGGRGWLTADGSKATEAVGGPGW